MPKTSPETSLVALGDTYIRDYDIAVSKKLGAITSSGDFFVKIDGVEPPSWPDDYEIEELRRTQMPGVPIYFAGPSDSVDRFVNPSIVIRRQDPQLAMERWSHSTRKYVAPAKDAKDVSVLYSSGLDKSTGKIVQNVIKGKSKYEEQDWPWPYDIFYTLLMRAEGARAEMIATQYILRYVHKRFQPRTDLVVTDSLGLEFACYVYCENPQSISEVVDIAHRVRGWSLGFRVLGYLDLEPPYNPDTVQSPPNLTFSQTDDALAEALLEPDDPAKAPHG